MWFGEIKEQTSQRHMFKRDWTTYSTINNYVTLSSEHNWEDLHYPIIKKSTHMHFLIPQLNQRGVPILKLVFLDVSS